MSLSLRIPVWLRPQAAIWIEAGINNCDPIEVAAGNDIALYRRMFGKNMAYRGIGG